MDYQLPHPATANEMFLYAAVCELQRLNANLDALVAVATPPQPSPKEGGSSEGVDGDGSVVVTLKEPKGSKKAVKE